MRFEAAWGGAPGARRTRGRARPRRARSTERWRRCESRTSETRLVTDPPAGEHAVAALERPDQLEAHGLGQLGPGHDRERPPAPHHLGTEGEEELVYQAGRQQVRVERGAALA